MRAKDIKSLIWLCRWYNGRRERLFEIHQSHLSAVIQLMIEELGGTPQDSTKIILCGFTLIFSPSPDGLALESITPPSFLDGEPLGQKQFGQDGPAESVYVHGPGPNRSLTIAQGQKHDFLVKKERSWTTTHGSSPPRSQRAVGIVRSSGWGRAFRPTLFHSVRSVAARTDADH